LYPGSGDAKTAAEALKSTDLEQLAQLSVWGRTMRQNTGCIWMVSSCFKLFQDIG